MLIACPKLAKSRKKCMVKRDDISVSPKKSGRCFALSGSESVKVWLDKKSVKRSWLDRDLVKGE